MPNLIEEGSEDMDYHSEWTRPVTSKQTLSFLRGSKDPNDELHKKFAIGIQLEQMAMQHANDYAQEQGKGLVCERVQSKFYRPVPVDSDITFKLTPGTVEPHKIVPTIDVHVGGEKAMTATFHYTLPVAPQEANSIGDDYPLKRDSAEQVAFGTGSTEPSYSFLAMSLVSCALFQGGKDVILAKMRDRKAPTYFGHTFNFSSDFYNLREGDAIRFQAAVQPIGDASKEKYCAEITATKAANGQSGPLLYTAKLMIKFVKLDGFVAPEQQTAPQAKSAEVI